MIKRTTLLLLILLGIGLQTGVVHPKVLRDTMNEIKRYVAQQHFSIEHRKLFNIRPMHKVSSLSNDAIKM